MLKQLLESGKVTEYSRVILSRLRRMDLGDFQDDLKLIEQAMELAKK